MDCVELGTMDSSLLFSQRMKEGDAVACTHRESVFPVGSEIVRLVRRDNKQQC